MIVDWVLSMLGLHHPPAIHYDDQPKIDLRRLNEAAHRTAAISQGIVKNALNAMELQALDKRPKQLTDQVDDLTTSLKTFSHRLRGD